MIKVSQNISTVFGLFAAVAVTTTANANERPVLGKDSARVDEDQSVEINVLSNDNDPDGDALRITSVEGLTNGVATINALENRITYTPNPDYNGTESFLYRVTDDNGGNAVQRVNVTIDAVEDEVEPNLRPTLGKDNVSLIEGETRQINVLSNDSDPNGDALSVTQAWSATHGTTTVNADNTITYTPDAGYFGADSFYYQASDNRGGLATQVVNVSIEEVANRRPKLGKDSALLSENTTVRLNVLSNDSDPDGDALSVTQAWSATHGTTTVNADNTITYTPDEDYFGNDAFYYQVSDDNGGLATQVVSVSIAEVDDGPDPNNLPPVAVRDDFTVDEDTVTELDVLLNDSDPNNDYLTVVSFTAPSHGDLEMEIKENNTIWYRPNAEYNGRDSFTYTVSDGQGAETTQTVTLHVQPDVSENAKHIYFAMQACNTGGCSVKSNEVTKYMDGPKITLGWDQPTRLENGQCIDENTQVTSYVLNMGVEQGVHGATDLWSLESVHVDCEPTGRRDEQCDVNIMRCTEEDYYVEGFITDFE